MFMRMIYDEKLAQAAYLIGCQRTGEAVVIDPERDVDRYIELAAAHDLSIVAAAETHIHADFVSGARELAERVGATVYVSDEGGPEWAYQWLDRKRGGGTYAHRRLRHGDTFRIGSIEFRVLHTPGHTPEHIVYLVTDRASGASDPIAMASGDFIFVGDLGRPDLLETAAGHAGAMEQSARRLYQTVQMLDGIPDFVQVWPGHGAGSACGKALGAVPTSTIGYERRFNPAIRAAASEREFMDFILSGQPEPPLYFATMKRVNKEGPRVLGELPRPARLDAAALGELETRRVALLDTRPWEAFRAGHVPGALWCPLSNSFSSDAGSFVKEEERIVLIIEPARLEEAVRDLVRVGLDHVIGWFDASALESYDAGGGRLVDVPEVDVADGARMIEEHEVQVLDVRRATEVAEGHLPGAINIAHTRLASRLDEAPRDRRLLVNCRAGIRSAKSAAFLQREGYQVVNLRGGYMAWDMAHGAATR